MLLLLQGYGVGGGPPVVADAAGEAFPEEVKLYGMFLEEIPHVAQLEEHILYDTQLDEQR